MKQIQNFTRIALITVSICFLNILSYGQTELLHSYLLNLDELKSVANSAKKSDLNRYNIMGEIKSVTATTYEAYMNSAGIATGDAESKFLETYNKSGYRTDLLWEDYGDASETKINFVYDSKNNVTEIKNREESGLTTIKIKYNNQDKEIERSTYNNEGQLIRKNKKEYNSQGFITKNNLYNATGELDNTEEFLYNPEDQLDSKVLTDKAGKLIYARFYKYDGKHKIIEEKFRNYKVRGGMQEFIFTYKYNAENMKTEVILSRAEKTPERTTYKYDAFGNMLQESDSHDEGFIYTYTYDNQNNWIKRVMVHKFLGDTFYRIIERNIKY